VLQHVVAAVLFPYLLTRRGVRALWAVQHRERLRLSSEIAEMRDLMPLLMKQRNGYRWTDVDRKRIGVHLRQLAAMSPYLILFVTPGGFFALPLLAWWLDRRRLREAAARNAAAK